ncbi:MAG: DUF2279 domain-containing protein [Candidatus Marinimicrobia bacterium]|nr:DUF2279 domain-containing protein [Candidatus Neomarinimicrobiota bacterium]
MIKKGIAIILLSFILNVAFGAVPEINQSKRSNDPWFGLDKLKHLSSSFVLTTTAYYIQAKMTDISNAKSLTNAGMVTISLGLGKEISDSRKPGGIFSLRDLTVNIAGIGLAFLFIQAIE